MSDEYIKRSDAIKALKEWCADLADKRSFFGVIKDVPAADVEPKQRWIPVSERLPEDGEIVLCAVYGTDMIVWENGESMEEAVRRARSGPGRVETGYLDAEGYWTDPAFGAPMMVMPRYWMPLPEPPKEEEEDEMQN